MIVRCKSASALMTQSGGDNSDQIIEECVITVRQQASNQLVLSKSHTWSIDINSSTKQISLNIQSSPIISDTSQIWSWVQSTTTSWTYPIIGATSHIWQCIQAIIRDWRNPIISDSYQIWRLSWRMANWTCVIVLYESMPFIQSTIKSWCIPIISDSSYIYLFFQSTVTSWCDPITCDGTYIWL